MSDSNFVVLRSLQDSVEARMLVELLEHHEIPVTSAGLEHRSLFGIAGGFVRIVLEVPEDRLAEAEELLYAFEEAPVLDEADGPYRGASSEVDQSSAVEEGPAVDPALSNRTGRGACFFALAFPFGCGHLYVRSPGAFRVLFMTAITTLVVGMKYAVVLPTFIVIALTDILGSQIRLREARGLTQPALLATALRYSYFLAPCMVLGLTLTALFEPSLFVRHFAVPGCEKLVFCAAAESEASGEAAWPPDNEACLDDFGEFIARHPGEYSRTRDSMSCLAEAECFEVRLCDP